MSALLSSKQVNPKQTISLCATVRFTMSFCCSFCCSAWCSFPTTLAFRSTFNLWLTPPCFPLRLALLEVALTILVGQKVNGNPTTATIYRQGSSFCDLNFFVLLLLLSLRWSCTSFLWSVMIATSQIRPQQCTNCILYRFNEIPNFVFACFVCHIVDTSWLLLSTGPNYSLVGRVGRLRAYFPSLKILHRFQLLYWKLKGLVDECGNSKGLNLLTLHRTSIANTHRESCVCLQAIFL